MPSVRFEQLVLGDRRRHQVEPDRAFRNRAGFVDHLAFERGAARKIDEQHRRAVAGGRSLPSAPARQRPQQRCDRRIAVARRTIRLRLPRRPRLGVARLGGRVGGILDLALVAHAPPRPPRFRSCRSAGPVRRARGVARGSLVGISLFLSRAVRFRPGPGFALVSTSDCGGNGQNLCNCAGFWPAIRNRCRAPQGRSCVARSLGDSR